jgi:hypothetical protein
VAGQAKWKFRLMLRKLLPFAFLIVSVPAFAATCNITASGPIQKDGTLGSYRPFEADVYQIQGTITANYVDDDEANNGYVTFTSPSGGHTVTVGMFLLKPHAKRTNTYAVRVAAGYVASGSWMAGTWKWSMNYSDRASNTCTASGSFTVQNAFAAGGTNGFLRNVGPNLETDGNGKLFFPNGFNWILPFYRSGVPQYGEAEIPALAYVNVSGTAVTYVSGTQFNTNKQPSGITANLSLCPSANVCTPYFNVTINSATSITLPSSGGSPTSALPAYLYFTRNFAVSFNHPVGNEVTLPQAAQFYAQWGETFNRLSMNNNNQPTIITGSGNFLGTGYNSYDWSNSGGTPWGIPAIDQWFAAAHAAGIHLMLSGLQNTQPCAGYSCNSTTLSNLQNQYAYQSARWGAFYDVLELQNETHLAPQAWVDDIGTVLTNGVSGIAGGNPADPYRHFITNSYFPNDPTLYSRTYGPFSSGASDPYLNFVDINHYDAPSGGPYPVYNWFGTASGRCPNYPGLGGNNLPRYNGEQAEEIGVAPSSQTASAPNTQTNAPRIVIEQQVFNQCGGAVFDVPSDYFPINNGAGNTPGVDSTWYDLVAPSAILEQFMIGLDTAAAPITVTLGGGCGSGACSYAALGSSNHIRLVLTTATGNSGTGVPKTVTNPSVTLKVPAANMTVKWINPATGANLASTTTTSGTKKLIYTGTVTYDLWLQLDYSTPPSQFSGLLTSSTDLTFVGVATPACSTWPIPAVPSTGGSYADSTWGTTTYRLANNSVYSGQLIPTYSRVQEFSSDNKHLFVSETPNNSYIDLYDATQTPPLLFPHTCLTREQ